MRLLLILAAILAGCNTDNTPLVYGTWDQPDSPLKTIRRVNADGSSPASIIESTIGLVVQKYSGRHNYANPLSPDGNFLSVYAQNEEGNWELNILPTRADGNSPAFQPPDGQPACPLHLRFFTG